jgi:hypothetical protein
MTPTTTIQRSLDEQSDDGIDQRSAMDVTLCGSPEVRR